MANDDSNDWLWFDYAGPGGDDTEESTTIEKPHDAPDDFTCPKCYHEFDYRAEAGDTLVFDADNSAKICLITEDGSGDYNGVYVHEAPDEDEASVFEDWYECESCGAGPIEVADFFHRTHVGYESGAVRCVECGEPLTRVG